METVNAPEAEYFIGCLHITSGGEFEEGKMKEIIIKDSHHSYIS